VGFQKRPGKPVMALGDIDTVSRDITFNYFDTGSGDYEKDLEAITEAIGVARGAFDRW
jgi:hypothetical protein